MLEPMPEDPFLVIGAYEDRMTVTNLHTVPGDEHAEMSIKVERVPRDSLVSALAAVPEGWPVSVLDVTGHQRCYKERQDDARGWRPCMGMGLQAR
jgi:hypothetical protein